ncbi:MAG: alpha/beta fold hydrolase [Acidimicrobiia bacterium]
MTVLGSPVRHGTVSANGLRLHVADYGGTGELILLVHGVTGHHAIWNAVAPALTTYGHVVAVDMRGHGDSQWSTEAAYSTADHASDLVAVAGVIGDPYQTVTVIGSSWGALVALAVALEAPDRIARIALVDIEPSFALAPEAVPERPRAFASHAEVIAFLRLQHPNASDALLDVVAANAARPAAGGLVPKHDPLFFTRWPFRAENWWPELSRVGASVLVVHAAESFIRRETSEKMAAALPRAVHVEITPSTHVIPVDAPDLLLAELAWWLA